MLVCRYHYVHCTFHSALSVITKSHKKKHKDDEVNVRQWPSEEAGLDLMEFPSVSLPPLTLTAKEWLGYASQRLPVVLIGSGLRQSISKCPSLWEKQ